MLKLYDPIKEGKNDWTWVVITCIMEQILIEVTELVMVSRWYNRINLSA